MRRPEGGRDGWSEIMINQGNSEERWERNEEWMPDWGTMLSPGGKQ